MIKKCENCIYFIPEAKAANKIGQCRRNPPQQVTVNVPSAVIQGGQWQTLPMFPVVGADLWCGEFTIETVEGNL